MMVRAAQAADIPALVALRMALFCEVGELARPDEDPALWQATLAYFTRAMSMTSRATLAMVWPRSIASLRMAW